MNYLLASCHSIHVIWYMYLFLMMGIKIGTQEHFKDDYAYNSLWCE